jgi:hypothetical protein
VVSAPLELSGPPRKTNRATIARITMTTGPATNDNRVISFRRRAARRTERRSVRWRYAASDPRGAEDEPFAEVGRSDGKSRSAAEVGSMEGLGSVEGRGSAKVASVEGLGSVEGRLVDPFSSLISRLRSRRQ